VRTSPAGIALIKEFEGFPYGGRPYKDPIGVWTIGYGHTAGVGPHTPRITEREASRLLEQDIRRHYEPALEAIPTSEAMTQNMFDAIIVFIYNCGIGAISSSTGIGRALRARQWRRAADELLRWDHADGRKLPGLTRRRQAERALFLRPDTNQGLTALTATERRLCREYDRLLAAKRAGRDTDQARQRRVALRAAMERRRKAIWHAAEAAVGGWQLRNRRVRYQALLARSG
jgi:lysozyme